MGERKQSDSTYNLEFYLVASSDHLSPSTGKTPTVVIRKQGGSFASPAGAVTEIANGWYQIAGNATDSSTLGPLLIHVTEASSDPFDCVYQIVNYDRFTFLPPVNLTQVSGSAVSTSSAQIGVNVVSQANIDFGSMQKTSLNAATPASVQNIPINADTYVNVHVKATDNIDFTALEKTSLNAATPASVQNISAQTGDSYARLGAPAGASVSADIATVNAKTTNLPASPAAVGSAMTVSGTVTVGTNNDKTGYTVSTVQDKTGYALTASEHTAISGTDVPAALNAAIPGSPTVASLFDYIQKLKWALFNKMVITDASGNVTVYKDDDATTAFSQSPWISDNSTVTTRVRLG